MNKATAKLRYILKLLIIIMFNLVVGLTVLLIKKYL
jgi:hypothetical protein